MDAQTLQLLVDAAKNRQLTLFIGADFPEDITGLPASETLAEELSRRLNTHVPRDPKSLLRVVEAIGSINYGDAIRYLMDRLDTSGLDPRECDRLAVQLSENGYITNYVTTRYDDLLEKAFHQRGTRLNRVVTSYDAAFMRGDRPTLLKLSGDLSQPESLILTQGQLLTLPKRVDSVGDLVTRMMAQSVLFIGFDLESPYFLVLRTIILVKLFELKALTPLSFVVPTAPVSKTDVRVWEDQNIRVIQDSPTCVLRSLAKALEQSDSAQLSLAIPYHAVECERC